MTEKQEKNAKAVKDFDNALEAIVAIKNAPSGKEIDKIIEEAKEKGLVPKRKTKAPKPKGV